MVKTLKPKVEGFSAYLEQIKKSIAVETDSAKLATLQKKLTEQTNIFEKYKAQLAEY